MTLWIAILTFLLYGIEQSGNSGGSSDVNWGRLILRWRSNRHKLIYEYQVGDAFIGYGEGIHAVRGIDELLAIH